MDEVTAKRQQRCAERPQGHTMTRGDFGICSNCLLKVPFPGEETEKTKDEEEE